MFSYKKVGGLHFIKIFRLGFAVYLQKKSQVKTGVVNGQQVQLNFN